MPQATAPTNTAVKNAVVSLAGDADDRLWEIDVQPGARPASVFEAMGLEKVNGAFMYQLAKPGDRGFFGENDNIYTQIESGDKLRVLPSSKVAF